MGRRDWWREIGRRQTKYCALVYVENIIGYCTFIQSFSPGLSIICIQSKLKLSETLKSIMDYKFLLIQLAKVLGEECISGDV